MYKLSFVIFFLSFKIVLAQLPHGAGFKYECKECHTTNTWKINGRINFPHAQTGFELLGQHKIIDCNSCHKTLRFNDAPQDCFGCHADIHNNTVGNSCGNCHSSKSWVIENINDIHRMSRFPLLGMHRQADCNACHKSYNNLQFEQLGVECRDCHLQDYEAAQSPNHKEAGFSTECQECHLVSDPQWAQAKYDHGFFPLVGGHRISNCFECHSKKSFEGLTQDCIACHRQDYNSTTDPNHKELNFSEDCNECHTINPNWRPAEYKEHDSFYPLVGAHKKINECSQCHANGYKNTPTDCFGCHQNDFNASTNPNHKAAGFSTDCESCHNLTAWKPATFDHDNLYFPIYSGKHNKKWNSCSECHANSGDYSQFTCLSCHEHNKSKMDDEHKGVNGYSYASTACLSCHPTGSEKDRFNHSATQFPLTGQHVTTGCSSCHTNGYSGTPTECSACHQNNYLSAAEPNHSAAGISLTCENCHTTNGWKPSTFNHTATGFELTGGHNLPQCSSCHSGSTSNASSDCYGCHSAIYNSAPEHVSKNYPKECQQCHNTTDWKQSTFDHSKTQFPLTGNHLAVDCNSCHTNGYSGTPTECSACHQNNYSSATEPNHSSAGISLTCENCHTTNGWKPSTFNHTATGFELAGGHNLPQCSSCHSGSTSNASSDCYGCHQNDYNNTNNPSHQSSGFGTQCADCHTTNAWTPATFDHDGQYFPIYSGKHKGKWNNCGDCHTNANDYSQFSCLTCHEHSQTKMNDKHKDVSGYSYNSSACLSCHPNGKE